MEGISYQDFFRQATGHPPYPYQVSLATSKRLPEVMDIPTGLGKTAAVVMAWLWRRFVGEGITDRPLEQVRSETPRRLVYCLPMRVLVEQTAGSARQWVENLTAAHMLPPATKPPVHILMGGEIDLDWDFWPERETILIGTQDQLLSRALNRGYAMSRFRWPIHFALLNNDCQWVMDEVQLMGPGLPTSIQLQGFRERFGAYSPARCIWMSATVNARAFTTIDSPLAGKNWGDICLDLGADAENPAVRSRLHARKSLHRCNTVLSKANQKTCARELAAEVATLHEKSKGLTIAILNRVHRAQEVALALKTVFADKGQSPGVTLIHSRFRPHERRGIERLLKDLSSSHTERHILVATQAIEAGVDISASTLVTELAPWPSLIQRFGRLNRYGELETGQAYWVDIEWKSEEKGKVIPDPAFALPYEGDELDLAREQLSVLTDASPYTLKGVTVSSRSKPYPLLRKK
jgi:CRISPR-associated endonuclease/helicase Cas3